MSAGDAGRDRAPATAAPSEPDHRRVTPGTVLSLVLAALVYLVPLAVFTSLAEDVAENGILVFDRPVMMWLHGHASPALTTTMQTVTQLGGVVAVPVLAVVASAVLAWRHRRRRDAVLLAAAVLGSTALNVALKAVFKRTRPDFWNHLVVENSYSFPSGHAMATMSLAAAAVVLAWRTRWRVPVLVVGVLYVLLIGVSRMYLGVHYPSDVIAGWCVAALWVAVVAGVMRLVERRRSRE